MVRGSGEGRKVGYERKWPNGIYVNSAFITTSSQAYGGTFAPWSLSLQELPLLFYFALSVYQLPGQRSL